MHFGIGARFELGNIVWKEYALQARISEEESKMMTKAVKHSLSLMDMLDVAGREQEILETAIRLKITYYDASYVYMAKERDLGLITEDSRLIKKTGPTAKISTLDDVK